jgi:glycosyltransferase involved in cell wall biosynthesis
MCSTELSFVTVIIPVYNEWTYIGKCLESLSAQDYPKDRFEVLVVDGGSDDGSQDIVLEWAQEHSFIRQLHNPRRITAAAMNIGIQNARGDVIILLGAHSHVASDFISKNVAYLSKTGADCVGGPIQNISTSYSGKVIALAMSSPFGVGNARFRCSSREGFVDTVAFGAYNRQVFDQIGLFDEAHIYSEDDEFNYRLRRHGGKIYLTPEIKSFYYNKISLKRLWRQYFNYGLGKVKTIRRHPQSAMPRQFVPFFFVSTLIVSGLIGLFIPISFWIFLSAIASYVAATLCFALIISFRGNWKYLPVLPVAFACLHFGYGLGFFAGLLKELGTTMPWLRERHEQAGI